MSADIYTQIKNTAHPLRIALGVPEWNPFQIALENKPADATYVLQQHIATRLKGRGHQVTLIAPATLEDFIFTEDHQQAKPARRTWSAGFLFNLLSKVIWKVQKLLGIPYLNLFSNYRYLDACMQVLPGHDLVYERNGLYNYGLAMACRKLNLPYVVHFEADQLMEFGIMGKPITGLLRWRAKQILRYNLKVADYIICVSKLGREHLLKEWNIPANKILVFPNAVDVEKFKPDLEARVAIRRSLNLELNPIIMFLGNFFYWHDVRTLLGAFDIVLKSHPFARLVLVGDGEYRPAMEKQVAELGLSHAVTFTGIVPHTEASRYVAAADITAVPYPLMQQKMWLSPLKLFEYMASGKAIIASAVGQINQVIRDGENGLLVPPGDVEAFAKALILLIRDPQLCHSLGEQARRDAEAQYSWNHYIIRLETLLYKLVARQSFNSI